MTSGSALFDTNILIDLFSGRREAKQALEAWPPQNAISLITWAIILATAQLHRLELITRNTKDFAGIPGVVTPYEIHPE
ncbi:MAG: hypothetical protein E7E45_27660 [Klebsiella pneumoniae]|nr:hypothetical protein [Klebsiella pneumoniae]